MKIGSISIALISPPHREQLVAELSVDNEQVAEIYKDSGTYLTEMYERRDGIPWELPAYDLLAATAAAIGLLERRLGPAD